MTWQRLIELRINVSSLHKASSTGLYVTGADTQSWSTTALQRTPSASLRCRMCDEPFR